MKKTVLLGVMVAVSCGRSARHDDAGTTREEPEQQEQSPSAALFRAGEWAPVVAKTCDDKPMPLLFKETFKYKAPGYLTHTANSDPNCQYTGEDMLLIFSSFGAVSNGSSNSSTHAGTMRVNSTRLDCTKQAGDRTLPNGDRGTKYFPYAIDIAPQSATLKIMPEQGITGSQRLWDNACSGTLTFKF